MGGVILLLLSILFSLIKFDVPFLHIGSLSFFSSFFIVMGRAYKGIKIDTGRIIYTIMFFVVVAVGSVFCGVSMLSYNTIQIVPYAICALLGSIMMLNVSQWLCSGNKSIKKFLLFVGDHTLEVLTWHFISFKLVSLLIIYIHGLPIEQLAYFPTIKEYSSYYWPLYSLFGIGLPSLVVFYRKKYIAYVKTK